MLVGALEGSLGWCLTSVSCAALANAALGKVLLLIPCGCVKLYLCFGSHRKHPTIPCPGSASLFKKALTCTFAQADLACYTFRRRKTVHPQGLLGNAIMHNLGNPPPLPPSSCFLKRPSLCCRSNARAGLNGSRFGSPKHVTSPPRARCMERPTSPDSLGGGELYSSYSMGQGLEGLICASPSAVRAALRCASHQN